MAAFAQVWSPPNCSICLETVAHNCGRTVVRLQCSHLFHLDCIGSAFNVKGIMECPNCRSIENGVWRRFNNEETEQNSNQIPVEDTHAVQGFHGLDPYSFQCPHGWESELPPPEYEDAMDHDAIFEGNPNFNHQQNVPFVTSEIPMTEFLNSIDYHHQLCNHCVEIVPENGHTSWVNWVADPSATLRIARPDFRGIPIELFDPMFGSRAPHEIGLNSSFGLAHQGSYTPVFYNHQMQPLRNSSSQVPQAPVLSPIRITPNGSISLFQSAAGQLQMPFLEAMSPYVPSMNVNLTNHKIFEPATPVDHHVQEADSIAPLQLFPDDMDPFLQEMHVQSASTPDHA
ncbi:hypothetical protein FEM48_Zijuj12G0193200 [Ziziphus jujuba var. spinosa]|uniref:RING-type domain-containing protein n=1 Tax=Ziziphus jujuba var. spinosa TaxID=714518 RepID=A0A978UF30_ZIZJJ|nr:hypothetical protein FEM48_Zijuj12G0193200 [Ziziphus jujuba var. spinosa]